MGARNRLLALVPPMDAKAAGAANWVCIRPEIRDGNEVLAGARLGALGRMDDAADDRRFQLLNSAAALAT